MINNIITIQSMSSNLLSTPPSSDAFRHSGGESLRWTSATVTLYLLVEDRRESLPGTEQNTSLGAQAPVPTSRAFIAGWKTLSMVLYDMSMSTDLDCLWYVVIFFIFIEMLSYLFNNHKISQWCFRTKNCNLYKLMYLIKFVWKFFLEIEYRVLLNLEYRQRLLTIIATPQTWAQRERNFHYNIVLWEP